MQIEHYILCLDTDQYAGNFERETTAYATGKIGDCGVGEEQSTQFFAETDGVSDSILDELDEHVIQSNENDNNCYRPCAIQPTPGWVNDGMGTHYRQSIDVPPTPEQIEKYRDTWRKTSLPHLNSARECTAKGIANWTPEALAREEARYAEIDTKVIHHWAYAYNSVGIFLDQPLSDETLKFVLYRAEKYLELKGVKLEHVRIVTVMRDEKSETLDHWKEL